MQNNFYLQHGKRIFDFFASLSGLMILSPLLLAIALCVKILDKGPVLHLSKRIGQRHKPFSLLKFRTMVVNAEKLGPLVTKGNDSRITPIGKFLRRTKLDELPQLINVLKGDMSFVGPRPEVQKYAAYFSRDYREILKIKPGITDYAAIEYRNEEELLKQAEDVEKVYLGKVLPAKIKLYKTYMTEIGFFTDIKIIFRTFLKVIR